MGRNLSSLARVWHESDETRLFLLPDLRGHGRSAPLPEDGNLETQANDVFELLDRLGWQQPVEIVGHSLGGRVGLAMLERAPQRVASLTLLDITPGPVGRIETPAVLSRLLAAPDQAPSRAAMREALIWEPVIDAARADWLLMSLERGNTGFRWRIERPALNRFFHRMSSRDLWPVLAHHGPRVRCIRGALSPYVTAADNERFMRAGCPETRTVAAAGHFLHVDNLAGVLQALH